MTKMIKARNYRVPELVFTAFKSLRFNESLIKELQVRGGSEQLHSCEAMYNSRAKSRKSESLRLTAYGEFDCEFDFGLARVELPSISCIPKSTTPESTKSSEQTPE